MAPSPLPHARNLPGKPIQTNSFGDVAADTQSDARRLSHHHGKLSCRLLSPAEVSGGDLLHPNDPQPVTALSITVYGS